MRFRFVIRQLGLLLLLLSAAMIPSILWAVYDHFWRPDLLGEGQAPHVGGAQQPSRTKSKTPTLDEIAAAADDRTVREMALRTKVTTADEFTDVLWCVAELDEHFFRVFT